MQRIVPFLWFDNEAEEAALFYTSLFDNSSIGNITRYTSEGTDIHGQPEGQVMTADFELEGFKMVALNGGPQFKITPAISFSVTCETEDEVDRLWAGLMNGGEVMMPLDKYAWSEKYGWVKDKFGVSWQVSLGKMKDVGQKVVPSLMYVGENGNAEKAINLYTSIFDDSKIVGILRYGPGEEQPEGTVKHAQFHLFGQVFTAMDTHPKYASFGFNEGISLQITCRTQEEIDRYWNTLTKGGEESQCGWLKDPFGVSWQVVPDVLYQMLQDKDHEKVARVTNAFMKMKKFDIQTLKAAYEGSTEYHKEETS